MRKRNYFKGSVSVSSMSVFLSVIILFCAVGLRAGGHSGAEKQYIIDTTGRRVLLKKKVKRIACLYAFSGHVVTMLGRGNDIVAVVNGLKRDVMLTKICPSIGNAAVPRRNGALNIEELLRVRPDVVFIQSPMGRNSSLCATLEKFDIPCLIVSYRSIRGQQEAVRIIGKAIGEEKKTREFLSYYNGALRRATDIARKIPQKGRKRIFHSINEPLKTDGPGMLSAELAARAATINVSVNKNLRLSGSDYFAGIEQVIKWNPDVILVNEEGVEEYILNSPRWSDIRAVQERRVYKMPTGISRWGHPGSLESPLALLWILKTVYPGYSGSINMSHETKYFYRSFFNLSLSEDEVKKVLGGRGMRLKKGHRGKGRGRKRKYR